MEPSAEYTPVRPGLIVFREPEQQIGIAGQGRSGEPAWMVPFR